MMGHYPEKDKLYNNHAAVNEVPSPHQHSGLALSCMQNTKVCTCVSAPGDLPIKVRLVCVVGGHSVFHSAAGQTLWGVRVPVGEQTGEKKAPARDLILSQHPKSPRPCIIHIERQETSA